MSHVLGVIPARFASTRFPGKPLASLGRRTLLEEVWRRARGAVRIDRLVIATDDQRIAETAAGFGAEVLLTAAEHPSGTDRVAEVVLRLDDSYEIIVNVQGDEPLVTPSSLDRLVLALLEPPAAALATLAEPISDPAALFDPNVVKVVVGTERRALYFSRSPIPYHVAAAGPSGVDFRAALAGRPGGLSGYLKHQGIYAYTREALLALTRLAPSPLESDERLEQLRALEAGFVIRVVESDFRSQAVDTPSDLERVVALLDRDAGPLASASRSKRVATILEESRECPETRRAPSTSS